MTDTATPPTEQRSIRALGLRAALFLVPAAVVLKVYWSTLVFLVSRWEKQEEYSYCFLIPPVVAYLIWRLRRPLAAVAAKPSWHGAWPLAFGLFLFWLGTSIGNYFLLEISLWLVAVGMLWLGFGWPRLKGMAFPLLFCLTMFPPPRFLVDVITQKLKLFSSQLGVFLIQSVGMPVYREGNIIDLGFTQLKVVEACSGLNSVISLGVLGILIAYLYRAVLWKKVLLVASTLPLAIVANSLRIALTGLIAKYLGTEYAQGFFHDFSGWLMFILELLVLYLEMRILDKLPGSLRNDSPSAAQSSGQTNAMMSESQDRWRQSDATDGRREFAAA
jgi:exosortase D (VPLPA-CTERM-specific)